MSLEIFVGTADGTEMSRLGFFARLRGAIAGEVPSKVIGKVDNRIAQGDIQEVVVTGGTVGVCVSDLVKYYLDKGLQVRVPLPDIRLGEFDCFRDPTEDILEYRRKVLLEAIGEDYSNNPHFDYRIVSASFG